LHRLGRTGRAGKEGSGLQILLPFESRFRSKLNRRGVSPDERNWLPLEDERDEERIRYGKQLVRNKHSTLFTKAETAYRSFVAYYVEYADRKVTGSQIQEAAASFADAVDLASIPVLEGDLEEKLQKR